MKKIYVVGIGMGNPKTITAEGLKRIEESEAVIGAKRMVDSFPNIKGQKVYSISPEEILTWADAHQSMDRIAVLMSGDVGFFSGTKKLKDLAEGRFQLELIPGISSLQYFASKLQISWEDIKSVSLHGRTGNLIGEVQSCRKVFVLTDRTHSPDMICKELADFGLGEAKVSVGERLSYSDEQITSGDAQELMNGTFDPLSVVLITNNHPLTPEVQVEDHRFLRDRVPMTKEEVRSISLAKLQIEESDLIYDVGAGTGAVSIDLARRARKGSVYAIETEAQAVALINSNKKEFQQSNLYVIEGTAPEVVEPLPAPDKAFIGGTKGNMEEILHALRKKNPSVRVVINVIALESIAAALEHLNRCGFVLLDVVQVSVAKAKKAGNYHMMMGQNPVFVITAQGEGSK